MDENKETMPGVNVKVVGRDGGTTTDLDGKYAITVDSDSVKLILFIHRLQEFPQQQ